MRVAKVSRGIHRLIAPLSMGIACESQPVFSGFQKDIRPVIGIECDSAGPGAAEDFFAHPPPEDVIAIGCGTAIGKGNADEPVIGIIDVFRNRTARLFGPARQIAIRVRCLRLERWPNGLRLPPGFRGEVRER